MLCFPLKLLLIAYLALCMHKLYFDLQKPLLLNYIFLGYILIQKDVSKMAKAYVSDLSLFLSAANKENRVILDSADLI